jgi:hypothetical protein
VQRRMKYWRASLALVAVVVALAIPTSAFASGNPNPGVLPPQSHPHGLTYGQWSAQWWQWAASFPASDNPVTDTTGSQCANGQSGPFVLRRVWFLAGSFAPLGGTITRSCTVPAGRAILFPVFNAEWSAAEAAAQAMTTPTDTCFVPLPPGSPSGTSDAALRACAIAQADLALGPIAAGEVAATVDGRLVHDLSGYRALSAPFDIFGADNTVVPAGQTRSVADGYWIMLTPLSPGIHTIHLTVKIPVPAQPPVGPFVFMTDVTYALTIAG